MKELILINFLLVITITVNAQVTDFPKITSSYLGQKPPGMLPEIFAPEISLKGMGPGCYGFLNNGHIFVFQNGEANIDWRYLPLHIFKEINGVWEFAGTETLNGLYPYNFTIGPDGQTLYFTSLWLPDGSGPHKNANIWRVKLESGNWLHPEMLSSPINSDGPEAYPSLSCDGTLYFISVREGGYGNDDIYYAELNNGEYHEVKNIRDPINTEYSEVDLYVAPDESYLIFCSDRPGGFGQFDLYISFRKADSTWGKPINMGYVINTPGQEFRPSVTIDSLYFFFTRFKDNINALYWVSANIIEELRSKE